ncbi:hypothetical protein B296_00008868 [Ensete ventricosum]|uniref:Uncharacterized protein n=1 Tax=Ensete ventricosum TaxID=4639 RepID=A0A427AWT1_ENSVE|nr:hypothetical protein B296_00008868 [Ensete ventricosum]
MFVAGAKIFEKGLKAFEVGGGLYRLGHGKFICLGILHRGSRSRLGLVLPSYTWMPGDSSLAPEGCVDSSRRQLVGRKTRWSTRAGVYFWSSRELQPFEVCCDVLEGVDRPRSEDLTWLSKASLFASASFCSPTDAPIIDAYTKVVVRGGTFYTTWGVSPPVDSVAPPLSKDKLNRWTATGARSLKLNSWRSRRLHLNAPISRRGSVVLSGESDGLLRYAPGVIVSLSYFSVDLLARFLDLQETFRIYEDEMNKFRISIPKGDPFAIFSSNMFHLYSTSSSLVNVELYHHKTNNVLQYMEDETEKFQPQVAKVDGIIVQIDLIN